MAIVTKREWSTKKGEVKFAWKVDYKDAEGIRRAKHFDRKKDAEAFRQRVEDELRRDIHVADRATVTFGQACQAWLGNCERRWRHTDGPVGQKQRGLSGATLHAYRSVATCHVLPAFGGVKLTEMTTRRIQDVVDDLSTRYKWRGIVSYVILIVKLTLRFSVERGWLRRSPLTEQRIIPPLTRRYSVAEFPSEEDLHALLTTVMSRHWRKRYHPWRNQVLIVTLALFTGMRRGEIVGLQWESVDFEAGVIHITHAMKHRVDGLGPPKTRSSYRTIPMAPQVRDALAWHAAWCGRTSGYVILGETGKPLSKESVSTEFNRLMQRAGLVKEDGRPKFPLHKLRHAAASLLLRQGLQPLHVMKILGHSDINLIFSTYGHILPGDETARVALTDVAARFPGPSPRRRLPPPEPEPVTVVVPLPAASAGAALEHEPEEERHRRAFELWREGYTAKMIGKELGVPKPTVAYWLRRFRTRGGDRLDTERLGEQARTLLAQGASMNAIARQLGIGRTTVARLLRSPASEASEASEAQRSPFRAGCNTGATRPG